MNKVMITGNLCRDNDVKVQQGGGGKVLRNTIASKRAYKNKEGSYDSDFINFVVFGQLAELLEFYTSKGDKLLLEGRWRTGKYQNQAGYTVYTNDLEVEKAEFLSTKTRKVEQTETAEESNNNPFVDSDDLPF